MPDHLPASSSSGPPAASALQRAFGVLHALADSSDGLTLSQLRVRTGLPPTSAHRLAGELAALGMVERDGDGRYRLGLKLFELAARGRPVALKQLALPVLEDIYEATHENVQLAVRDGAEVVYVEWITGRRAVGVRIRVGLRFPMHATGVGLVLLAHAPVEVQEAVLAAPLRAFTPRTVVEPRRLRAVLAEVRHTGVAVTDRQVSLDSVSVAAPVRDAGGRVVAALSVVAEAERAQPQALRPLVVAGARAISRALAGGPAGVG